MNIIKDTLREVFISLHLDLSKNLKYDRLTRAIIKKYLQSNYNCVDVGCHKGEILDLMLKYSPKGNHYAFEPIPYLFNDLKVKYSHKATIFPYALANSSGTTTFQLVKNAPAYSGLKRRQYDITNPDIEEISVQIKTLDELLPDQNIHFMKIDVEGAEFGVLSGAKELLKRSNPVILFECGKGACDFYGTTPADIFNLVSNEIGLGIYTLNDYIKGKAALKIDTFVNYFETNKEYYFVATNNKL